MTTQKKATTTEKSHSTVILRRIYYTLVLVSVFYLLYKGGTNLYQKKVAYDLAQKNSACPTLLSISRSARDTLLVMKSESLCTAYVLDNIQ